MWRRMQDARVLKVELQQLLITSASTPSFCITCCISALLAGTPCRERSVSFLLLVGLITAQAVPSSRCGCNTHAHTHTLPPPTFVSSKNPLPVFIVFWALWRCRNPASSAKNKPRSRSLCAQWEKTNAPLSMHANPDVMRMCMHARFDAMCLACTLFTAKP